MQKVIIRLDRPWPLAGKMRQTGEVLLEGLSPIAGLTGDKLLSALTQGAAGIEITTAEKASATPARKKKGR